MKISKNQEKMIQYAVRALEEDANERFKNVQCKKKKTILNTIKHHMDAIVCVLFMAMIVGFTLDNLSVTRAMEEQNHGRSPAVVEMYMAHDTDVSEEE
jgi:hypothetical protein